MREVETLAEWAGGARRFTAKLPGPRQGQAILVQTADLRIVGAADRRLPDQPAVVRDSAAIALLITSGSAHQSAMTIQHASNRMIHTIGP